MSMAQVSTSRQRRFAANESCVTSHHAWTLRDMDHIYVLDHGAIVEHGRYEDLISANGRFAEIFANQTLTDTLAARPGP